MLGETINLMTLGGLALAVGILVDDARSQLKTSTVTSVKEGHRRSDSRWRAADRNTRAGFNTEHLLVFVPMFLLTGVRATSLCVG